MKKTILLSTLLSATLALTAFGDDPTKLVGKATCAKCDLGIADKCRAAVVVTGGDGKPVTYLTEANPESKKLHSEICKGGKDATVEGTVSEKDGAKIITVTKYEIK